MLQKGVKFFEKFRSAFHIWLNLLIYFGSLLFAVGTLIIFIRKGINPLTIGGLGAMGVFINYVLYRKFSKRFPLWHNLSRTIKRFKRIGAFFLVPPVSIFLISAAFSLFILSLFLDNFAVAWQTSLQFLPWVFNELGLYFIALPVVMFVIFLPVLIVLIYLPKSKLKYAKFVAILAAVIYAMSVTFFLAKYFIDAPLPDFSIKIMRFVLGFIPVHWFFEIFVASVVDDKVKQYLFRG